MGQVSPARGEPKPSRREKTLGVGPLKYFAVPLSARGGIHDLAQGSGPPEPNEKGLVGKTQQHMWTLLLMFPWELVFRRKKQARLTSVEATSSDVQHFESGSDLSRFSGDKNRKEHKKWGSHVPKEDFEPGGNDSCPKVRVAFGWLLASVQVS